MTDLMKIAIFTNNYLPNPYGVAQSIESFRRQFEKRGHAVYVFAPRAKGYLDQNPNAFRYPSVDVNYKISFPLPIPFSSKTSKILNNLELDIIHSQHHTLLGSEASKWAKKKNIPLVFTWHTLFDQYVHFAPLVPQKWAARWIVKKAVNYANAADYVVTPTDSVKEIIKKWGVTNVNLISIPTGVEEETYQGADGSHIRKKMKIAEDETILLLVSRLTAEKNIDFLFKSVFEVLKKKEKAKLMVVGGGNLLPRLKLMSKKNGLEKKVLFMGVVDKSRIKDYYAASDIFVYASKSETQGLVVSEAMYMGLPVVAVGATGSKDLVKNKMNGFLVSENENEFALAVENLINNRDLRQEFGAASERIAKEKYTDKICADKMLKVYEEAIAHKNN